MNRLYVVYCSVLLTLTASNYGNVFIRGVGGSSSGSGSGSGSGMMERLAPELQDCPMGLIYLTVTRDSVITLNITSDNLPVPSGNNVELVVFDFESLSSELSLILNETCNPSTDCISITIDANTLLTDTNMTSLNLSIVARDSYGNVSDPCVLAIELTFITPGFCPSVSPTGMTSAAAGELAAIVIVLDTDVFSSSDIFMLRIFVATQMNTLCSINCSACNLERENCTEFLQVCQSFSVESIVVIDVTTTSAQSNRKRQTQNTTTLVTLYVEAPPGVSVIGSSSNGLTIPATITQRIFTMSSAQYEMLSGIDIVGSPELLVPISTDAPVDTGVDVAIIVVPIVAGLLVIATVVGVVLIIVIACVLKKMKTNKVMPSESEGSHPGASGTSHHQGKVNTEEYELEEI